MKCGSCGAHVVDDANFCPKCGREVRRDDVTCGACEASCAADDVFCRSCGEAIVPPIDELDEQAPTAIIQQERVFFTSGGRPKATPFDETDVAWSLMEKYRNWVDRPNEQAWWAFYGALLENAVQWPHGELTVRVLADRLPKAKGRPSIRRVFAHLSKSMPTLPLGADSITAAANEAGQTARDESGGTVRGSEVVTSGTQNFAGSDQTVKRVLIVVGVAVVLVFVLITGTNYSCAKNRMKWSLGQNLYSVDNGGSCPLGGAYEWGEASGYPICSIHGVLTENEIQAVRSGN